MDSIFSDGVIKLPITWTVVKVLQGHSHIWRHSKFQVHLCISRAEFVVIIKLICFLLLVKMEAQVNSSLPHTTTAKIMTKLQNNYHPELSETELGGSPTTKELKKSHSSRGLGGGETWIRTEMWGDVETWKHEKGDPIPVCDGQKLGEIYQDQGIPAPNQTTQPRVPALGRWVPISSGCNNQCGLGWCKKDLGIMQTHPTPGLQHQGSSWKGTSGI